ncbi:protein AAR2 homolog [Diadema antillarum]|uniref:protein AAR2 homolog n=1 Tax=Diadema antillarum TaxID=105358 RepID=UPI003A8A46CF
MAGTEMSQDAANILFEEGAALVLLDVPQGTEFGIDYNSWNTGELFKGVKMIPPGVHFIYYSAVNLSSRSTAPRTGFFHFFKAREIVIKRWDAVIEDFADVKIVDGSNEEEKVRLREHDAFLGAYPYESLKRWVSLTNLISEDIVEKLSPLSGKVVSVAQLVPDMATRTTADRKLMAEANKELHKSRNPEDHLPQMHREPGTEIRFSRIPARNYPDGATPREITKYSLDHTHKLDTLLSENYASSSMGILAELQLAFVCFLIGQVYDAFDQWKRLVHLLSSCVEAISTHSELYSALVTVLHFQLREIPEDFFVDIVSSDNFLTITLRELFINMNASTAEGALKEKGRKFKKNLTKKYNWDFDEEPEDEAPVVVDL